MEKKKHVKQTKKPKQKKELYLEEEIFLNKFHLKDYILNEYKIYLESYKLRMR
ncbi:hypothetical protein [Paenibacillus alkalitolerans]|uniref:hypothetical protein n=1 Tax=Paenibacillus alkalitolerans TaxID=2799335 RepID=UPI0018F64223|nr:hypothetical protein [Paenibacillus alkalitolerans]